MISELFAKYESGAKQYISNTRLLRSLRLNTVCVHGLFVRKFIRSNSSRADVSTFTISS